jgi:hypothetical protein
MRILGLAAIGLVWASGQRPTPIPYEASHDIRAEELARLRPGDFDCPPCEGGREYRWPTKTLSDPDAGLIRLTPVRAVTVRDVQRFARPSVDMHDMRGVAARRFAPYELEVFRVRARLRALLPSNDRDVHLFIEDLDDPSSKMIVEVIEPRCYVRCARDAALHVRLQAARRALEAASFFKPELQWHYVDAIVNVTGVGFFDYSSGPPVYDVPAERMRAINGFELHPVLDFAVEQGMNRN